MDPLLERGEELAALESVVEAACDGRGQLVLVAGEAGIGKTSLVRALRARLGERAAFLVGACEPLSVPVPLAPLRELVAAEPAAPPGEDAFAVAQSVLGTLRALAPAVAVVEDAHWADPATVDVLRLLARRVEDAGAVVVVTYRDDELAVNAPLALLVGDLVTSPAARRMALAPLSPAAVRSLAGPADVDADGLWRLTGGNPFLVVEALALRDGLPSSVRDATLARVGRLGSVARGVVDAAAVHRPARPARSADGDRARRGGRRRGGARARRAHRRRRRARLPPRAHPPGDRERDLRTAARSCRRPPPARRGRSAARSPGRCTASWRRRASRSPSWPTPPRPSSTPRSRPRCGVCSARARASGRSRTRARTPCAKPSSTASPPTAGGRLLRVRQRLALRHRPWGVS